MKRFSLILMVCLMATTAMAVSLRQHQVRFVNEFEEPITDITSVTISAVGGSSATIYADRAGSLAMTNPATTSSTNTGLRQSEGYITWFQRAPGKKLTVTNGTKTLTIDNMDEGDTRFPWYPNYIGTAASLSVTDNQEIAVGTGSDYVLAWSNGSSFMSWIPTAGGTDFNIGTASTAYQSNFSVFVGDGAGGLIVDEGVPSMAWTGGAFYANYSGANTTDIGSGTNTGTIDIGSSTAGNITVDTTGTAGWNSDGKTTISTTDASADILVDATAGAVEIRGTEEAGDAVNIVADGTVGGVDITSGTGDIVMVSTDDISMTVNTTTTDNIIITNTPGTAENSIDIDATAGGIDIDYATAKNMAVTGGQFIFTSNEDVASAFSVITNTGTSETVTVVNTQGTGADAIKLETAAAGDIHLDAGDDLTLTSADDTVLTSAGKVTIVNTEAVTVSGAMTVTGDTSLISVTRIDTPVVALVETKNAEITESGTTFILNHATEFATTLPTVASSTGVTFRFICKLAPDTGSFTVVTDSGEDAIVGSVVVDGANIEADGPDDTITFTASAAAIGDWVELTSDGTYWYLSGQGAAATSIVPSGT